MADSDNRPSASEVVGILEKILIKEVMRSNSINEGINLGDEETVSELVTSRSTEDSGYQTSSINMLSTYL